MGLATHNPNGRGRLGLSATDAAVDHRPSVVLASPHDFSVAGPAQRLPQASPGPTRQGLHARPRLAQVRTASPPAAKEPSLKGPSSPSSSPSRPARQPPAPSPHLGE